MTTINSLNDLRQHVSDWFYGWDFNQYIFNEYQMKEDFVEYLCQDLHLQGFRFGDSIDGYKLPNSDELCHWAMRFEKMAEMSHEVENIVQYYDKDGNKRNGIAIQKMLFSEPLILLNYITNFVDSYHLKVIEFISYKTFPALKVHTINDYNFYLTLEPFKEIDCE